MVLQPGLKKLYQSLVGVAAACPDQNAVEVFIATREKFCVIRLPLQTREAKLKPAGLSTT